MIGLNQTITYEPPGARTLVGSERSFGPAVTYRARVQQRTKLVLGKDGKEVVSDTQIHLAAGTAIAVDGRVTYGGRTGLVILVERKRSLDKEHHVLAYLGG